MVKGDSMVGIDCLEDVAAVCFRNIPFLDKGLFEGKTVCRARGCIGRHELLGLGYLLDLMSLC